VPDRSEAGEVSAIVSEDGKTGIQLPGTLRMPAYQARPELMDSMQRVDNARAPSDKFLWPFRATNKRGHGRPLPLQKKGNGPMNTYQFHLLMNGTLQRVTIQADTLFNARAMADRLYGACNIQGGLNGVSLHQLGAAILREYREHYRAMA
jgi:hypothetical protein